MPHQCRLLDLPAELRVYILELVLAPQGTKDNNGDDGQENVIIVTRFYTTPPLLMVCQRIRDEASSIYYGNYIFEIRTHWNCIPWLRSRTEDARARLRILRLVMVSFQGASTRELMERIAGQIRAEELGRHTVLEILKNNSIQSPWTAEPFLEWKRSIDGR